MGEGSLTVLLKTAREALPAAGTAEIIGTGAQSGFAVTLLTDESGVTEQVRLPAPDQAVSLDPESEELPYGTYTVTVTAENFKTVIIEGVQIYDRVASQLPVELTPYFESGVRRSSGKEVPTLVSTIDPPAIRSESQSGRGPLVGCGEEEEEIRIQRSVYIPRYITVHLGRPQSAAANVTVNFAYYIKNVCCSEIYPTWPENAIRANVYAQISLALNRVYTEWYLSKGYSFQITNSTQYDQYFVANRNLFDNVSRIVDSIFNTYLRRVGDFAPYYAEYCSGTTVTCPGMSQWGTVSLANQGYTPVQILRRYYGNNFELVTTQDIRPIENSYRGTPLSEGSTGEDVRIIQRQLARIARNYPSIGKVSADGKFGSATKQSVKTFQKIFGLTSDGIVGKRTWYQISYIYVSVKKLAQLGSEKEPYPDTGGSPGPGNLRVGSRGKEVAWLQYRLSYLAGSFYQSSIRNLTPDGIFGSATETSVRDFQSRFGLKADGIAGIATQAKLEAKFLAAYEDNHPNSFFGAYPGTVLRQGDRGKTVQQMQFYLLYLSFNYAAVNRIRADGIFGGATKEAVLAFQTLFGLSADGAVGPKTWAKLVSVFNQIQTASLFEEGQPDVYPGEVLRRGSQGVPVRRLQNMLWAISRRQQSIPPLNPSGYYGETTSGSVDSYQREYGLGRNGQTDRETWESITETFNLTQSDDKGCSFTDVPWGSRLLKEGDRGIDVRILSYYLAFAADFEAVLVPAGQVTDLFTPQMRENVENFQELQGLPVTGEADADTWNALYTQYVADYRIAYPACADLTEQTPSYTLYPGSEGARVTNLQLTINSLAPFYCGVKLIDVTGRYGPETETDIRNLQAVFGLPSTGETDPLTWETIRDVYAAIG